MADDIKPVKIISFDKYTLYAPSAAGVRKAKLVWGVRDGNPRIAVFTNDPADTTLNGVISAPMDPVTFYTYIELLKKAAAATSEIKYKLDCFTTRRDEEGKPGDKFLLSEVYVGKDSDGMVWVSVVAENRPKLKFVFSVSDWHKIYKADGTELSKGEYSSVATVATINALLPMYQYYMQKANDDYMARPKKTANGAYPQQASKEDTDDINFM